MGARSPRRSQRSARRAKRLAAEPNSSKPSQASYVDAVDTSETPDEPDEPDGTSAEEDQPSDPGADELSAELQPLDASDVEPNGEEPASDSRPIGASAPPPSASVTARRVARAIGERARSIPPKVISDLFSGSAEDGTGPVGLREPPKVGALPKILSKPPAPPRPSVRPSQPEIDPEAIATVGDPLVESVSGGVVPLVAPTLTDPPVVSSGSAAMPSGRRALVLAAGGFLLLGVAFAVHSTRSAPAPGRETPPAVHPAANAGIQPHGVSADGFSVERELSALEAPGTVPSSSASDADPKPPDDAERAKAPAAAAALPLFDTEAANRAISDAFRRAAACRAPGDPSGLATVTLTYAPSGRVTTALVAGPFAGTPIGSCIAATLRSARVPAFSGDRLTVKRSVELK